MQTSNENLSYPSCSDKGGLQVGCKWTRCGAGDLGGVAAFAGSSEDAAGSMGARGVGGRPSG